MTGKRGKSWERNWGRVNLNEGGAHLLSSGSPGIEGLGRRMPKPSFDKGRRLLKKKKHWTRIRAGGAIGFEGECEEGGKSAWTRLGGDA